MELVKMQFSDFYLKLKLLACSLIVKIMQIKKVKHLKKTG